MLPVRGRRCRYEELQESLNRLFLCEGCLQRGREGQGKYGDVVILAELLCGFGDGAGGLRADGLGSVEAEELATFVRSFYDSVRNKGEAIVWIELEGGFGVTSI